MPRYNFLATGAINASSESYAKQDVTEALKTFASVGHYGVTVQLVPEYRLCSGSEEPATTVNVDSHADRPYNVGRCRACGEYVPLLSAGQFEVIKHFAPSNYAPPTLATNP